MYIIQIKFVERCTGTTQRKVCKMLRFEQIEIFVKVYSTRNITKAAEELYVTQQSVSHSLKRLEEDIGRKLFIRTVSGVRPTAEGDRFYSMFYPIVLSYREAISRYTSSSSESVITLAVTPAVIRNLTPNVLFDFFRDDRSVLLDMKALKDDALERFVREDAGRFGIVTIPERILDGKFEYTVLKPEPMSLLVCNDNPLSKEPAISLSVLRNERFMGITGCRFYLEAINRVTETYGFSVTTFFESDDVENLFDLVEYGTGVMLCRDALYEEVHPENCTLVPFKEHEFDVCTAFVYRDYDMLPDIAKKYMGVLKQAVESGSSQHQKTDDMVIQ